MSSETYRFTWEDVEIELTYKPKAFGGAIAHLEVLNKNPEGVPRAAKLLKLYRNLFSLHVENLQSWQQIINRHPDIIHHW
ncbi:hypothetical protein D9R08_14855 [Rhodophyticola porphyridii]|uniref:Uncharacterized protein n=1 Tax=Rhodophyticola porphyridii TaxID=1852017 RepID=A0A3L9XYH7_9RHOB|nr:hypothetical protein D9R08_14855 [Rhodophyticola porphyridii]